MIRLQHIEKSFGGKKVLKNIDLEFRRGELTFLVGTSGAGKTTLLNLLGGLDNPTSGKVLFQGIDIAGDLPAYRGRKVGFIFQHYNLIPGLSVRDNILLGLEYADAKISPDALEAQIRNLNLKDAAQSAETLSGGEKQRTAVIRSICKQSDILLADEPTGNLDSENSERVFQLLREIRQDHYCIVVTHDEAMARKYGDRLIRLSDGTVAADEILRQTEESAPPAAGPQRKPQARRTSWRSVFMLGKNSVKRRLSRIISIALVIALAITSLVIVSALQNSGSKMSRKVNVNYLESDLISLFYPATLDYGQRELPFTQEKIAEITQKYGAKEIVPVYAGSDSWLLCTQELSCSAVIKEIALDTFFEERIMSYDITGAFPQNAGEIILAEDSAAALFGSPESAVGQTVMLQDGSGNAVTYQVCGINRTVNPFDKMYSFIAADSLYELVRQQVGYALAHRITAERFRNEPARKDATVWKSGEGVYGPFVTLTGDEQILFGKAPESTAEIMLPSSLLPYALANLQIACGQTEEEIKAGRIPQDVQEALCAVPMAINLNGLFEVKICGVYQDDRIGICGTEELADRMRQIEPVQLDVYASDEYPPDRIRTDAESGNEYTCYLQQEMLKFTVGQQTQFYRLAFILIGLILALVSLMMISSFVKIVVLERRQEIAIMKSLGATGREVLLTLWYDMVFTSLLAVAAAAVITGLTVALLPHIRAFSAMPLSYPVTGFLLLSLIFSAVICGYTLIRLRSIADKTPASLLTEQ